MATCRSEKHPIKKRLPDRFIPYDLGLSRFNIRSSNSRMSSSVKKKDSKSSNGQRGKGEHRKQLLWQLKHERAMASALGYTDVEKVLSFTPRSISTAPIGRRGSLTSNTAIARALRLRHSVMGNGELFKSEGLEPIDHYGSFTDALNFSESIRRVSLLRSERVLDAPDLLNDYYSTLVDWSATRDIVAVALKKDIYLWSVALGPQHLPLPESYSTISCIAFSANDYLAVGRRDGSLMCYNLEHSEASALYNHSESSIACVAWKPNSDTDLYIGDQSGSVTHIKIYNIQTYSDSGEEQTPAVFKCSTIKAHSQQVCAITFSPNCAQMAVGGNDNLATVWSLSKETSTAPVLQYEIRHKAAIKAIAFCPWLPALLATGGGTSDRTIKFWHAKSGTLLNSIDVKHQVTSIVWSRQHKQLVATFGFGDPDNPLMLAVYSFPGCRLLKQCPIKVPSCRVLSAALSPDNITLCIAASDQTLKFFKVWEPNSGQATQQESNKKKTSPVASIFDQRYIFGSDIIDMLEGIDEMDFMRRL